MISTKVSPSTWIAGRMGRHYVDKKAVQIFAAPDDPRPALAQFDAHMEAYVLMRSDAAVKAALVGMVPKPMPPDLTSSKDQYGAVRCLSCGCPVESHNSAECPRGAAERWAAKGKGVAG